MWNPHSVMFEVGWCVTLYTTVLMLEFSPLVLEKLPWQRPYKIVKSITVPLVIVGVLLSTMHQSSLGTLYLIVPHKLHPLWYSPLLPVFFFISAIALGCAMTIFESYLSLRAFRKGIEFELLNKIGQRRRRRVVGLPRDSNFRHAGTRRAVDGLSTNLRRPNVSGRDAAGCDRSHHHALHSAHSE